MEAMHRWGSCEPKHQLLGTAQPNPAIELGRWWEAENAIPSYCWWKKHQLIWQISHYLQGFIHPRWCRISSINRITHPSNPHLPVATERRLKCHLATFHQPANLNETVQEIHPLKIHILNWISLNSWSRWCFFEQTCENLRFRVKKIRAEKMDPFFVFVSFFPSDWVPSPDPFSHLTFLPGLHICQPTRLRALWLCPLSCGPRDPWQKFGQGSRSFAIPQLTLQTEWV